MGMELSGDWNKLLDATRLQNSMEKHMGDALERGAEIVRGYIVKGIRDQSLGHTPLKPATLARKAKKSQSDLILIAEGDYIASFATDKEAWDTVHVGTNFPQSRAMEHGYEPAGIPARPHVEPALEASIEEYLEELQSGLSEMWRNV